MGAGTPCYKIGDPIPEGRDPPKRPVPRGWIGCWRDRDTVVVGTRQLRGDNTRARHKESRPEPMPTNPVILTLSPALRFYSR